MANSSCQSKVEALDLDRKSRLTIVPFGAATIQQWSLNLACHFGHRVRVVISGWRSDSETLIDTGLPMSGYAPEQSRWASKRDLDMCLNRCQFSQGLQATEFSQ